MPDCDHQPTRDNGLDGPRCTLCGSQVERVDGDWQAVSDDDGRVVGP